MNKEYKIKLDLNKKLYNKKMAFNQFDENVNDFYIEVTKNNEVVKDLDKSIITLVAIKPNNAVDAQFIEVKEGQIYANLKPSMCDLVGNYQAKAMIVLEGEIVTTDTINYSVNEDKIISRLNEDVVSDERFTLFTDALARLSDIESSEEQRVINEAERILSEENRKIEETKRAEAELIRQHEEADRSKYDATRESNENIRKQNESIRLSNETNRIDEEAKRVEEENKRKLAEDERNANYNFMTEDEERRRSEANTHKEAEVLRVQAETNRVNEEAKRRTTEQARVSAENTRVSNENTRKANEETRQSNEAKRVEAETQRQSRYNSFITDAEANANNFEIYTNNAKVKEEERKANELDRKSQEVQRVSNENERLANEETRKANEVVREENEISRQDIFEDKVDEFNEKITELNTTKENFVSSINTKVDNKISEIEVAKSDMTNTVSNKVNEVETRFNALTSKQQQDAEVIDARDGETSLKARLDRDIEKAKQVYVNVEGSHISTDSSSGYLKDVEIKGNTIQDASNLADIRSVGDKVEGQELYEIPVLSCGKNLFCHPNTTLPNEISYDKETQIYTLNGTWRGHKKVYIGDMLEAKKGDSISVTVEVLGGSTIDNHNLIVGGYNERDGKNSWVGYSPEINTSDVKVYTNTQILDRDGCDFITFWVNLSATFNNFKIRVMFEKNTQATPYEPYQEDKLTILSPVQLEKVGDVADRIIEKDGVWGVEKNIIDTIITGNESGASLSTGADGVKKYFNIVKPGNIYNIKNGIQYYHITNKLKNGNAYNSEDNVFWLFFDGSNTQLRIRLDDSYTTKEQYIEWLKSNNILVKYITTQPQFIPLPHDQQIKLRTFANKTNISFLTEIEGTIKAQVPKSLGATVNTHTEQIRSLNNELNRVKKLEESTVSTVTTESDFTTVEATSNGYFEDVKLEGKTLVNLAGSVNDYFNQFDVISRTCMLLKCNTEYTAVISNKADHTVRIYGNEGVMVATPTYDIPAKTTIIKKLRTKDVVDDTGLFKSNSATGTLFKLDILLLEGDHTQNPPNGCIEGLKSVGQDVDEVSVESVKGDGNLFDATLDTQTKNGVTFSYDGATGEIVLNGTCTQDNTCVYFKHPTKFIEGNTYYLRIFGTTINSPLAHIRVYDDKYVGNNLATTSREISIHKSSSTRKMVNTSIRVDSGITFNNFRFKVQLIVNEDRADYILHQSDKKRLLYYNEEAQTWEKPILRQWDSIEKHANGKYYYHKRSGEVVLNGSESWNITGTPTDMYISFKLKSDGISSSKCVSDKLNIGNSSAWRNEECLYMDSSSPALICITILKSKLSTQDVEGFKQWLQANNVTVVYQLAQEKVYECTNIDLITYANETNYIVNSGAIVPKTTLKVHNNISNVVSLLQKKVSLLESNVTSYMITQNRLMLASRYNADTVSFKVDVATLRNSFEYDNDLYELILNNILVGKDNYNRDYIENLIIFYWMDFVISDEMYLTLFEIIEEQHNPKIIEEETPLI